MPTPTDTGDQIDARLLLQVLTALQAGDDTVRMPQGLAGVAGQAADTLNAIIATRAAAGRAAVAASRRTESLLAQSQSLARELRQTNEELAQKARLLSQQNIEVERAKLALEEKATQLALSSRYKSEFLANMSHELRTPLNSLLILAQQLADNPDGNLSARQVEFARTMHGSGSDLLTLINDILDLSKIESGTVTLDVAPYRFQQLHHFVERTFRHMAEARHLDFTIALRDGLPAALATDSTRLQQVLKNLLSNAFKFTPHGRVSLEIGLADGGYASDHPTLCRADAVLAFAVSDTGVGIAADKLQLIFEAFQQADGSTARKYGGTGLGLSISRELARLLGGEIRVRSTVGSGSTFTLFLPWFRAGCAAPGQAAQTEPAAPDLAMGTMPTGAPLPVHPPAPRAHDPGWRQEGHGQPDRDGHGGHGRHNGHLGHDGPAGHPGQDAQPDRHRQDGRNGRRQHDGPAGPHGAGAHDQPHHQSGQDGQHGQDQHTGHGHDHDDRDRLAPGDASILIVAADADFAAAARDCARACGYKTVLTTAGLPALSLARDYQPAVILLACDLPDGAGLAVLDRLKRDPATRHLPVHMLAQRRHRHAPGAAPGPEHDAIDAGEEDDVRAVDRSAARGDMRGAAHQIGHAPVHGAVHAAAASGGQDAAQGAEPDAAPDLPPADEDPRRQAALAPTAAGWIDLPVDGAVLGRLIARLRDQQQADAAGSASAGARSQSPGDVTGSLARRKVLIVDDDVRNIFALSSLLERQHMQVSFAENGRDGIAVLHDDPSIEIVLMDIMMPEMDGYDTMRAIRRIDRFRALPIIALTAKAMKGDRDKCIAAGASDYITKPVDVALLLSLMHVWLH
ncbi:hypothetical protein ASF61_08125 [Duganella sp. Leaf126]|nr:response regulator [Duganella sp. Leaf126]KQQ36153.1 hypothetical protein ASF61_08125 [Duganella sp. Leaf126]